MTFPARSHGRVVALRPALTVTRTIGRLLVCTACGDLVDLIEVPVPRVAEDGFVCGECQTTRRRDPS